MAVHEFVDPAEIALIVVDLQNAFVIPGQPLASPFAPAILPAVADLAQRVRSAGGTVAWTRHSWSEEPPHANPAWFNALVGPDTVSWLKALRPGSAAHAVHPDLRVDERDIRVDKYRPSAFLPDPAGLHGQLQARGIDTVIICGAVTNFCCQATARDALMRDYRVCFPPDLNAGMIEAGHRATIEDLAAMGLFDLRSGPELIAAIAACGTSAR